MAGATKACRATRSPPRCSRTACTWSARSFKYHRPRGILTAGAEEPNALVTVRRDAARTTPNLRATQVELYDGLCAESQNRWPSLGFDLGALNDLLSPLFPAGFYYKTFMWPRSFWACVYEPLIRARGGPRARARRCRIRTAMRSATRIATCWSSAPGRPGSRPRCAAADAGARVILCDEQAEFGGSLLAERAAHIDGLPAADWLARDERCARAQSARAGCCRARPHSATSRTT